MTATERRRVRYQGMRRLLVVPLLLLMAAPAAAQTTRTVATLPNESFLRMHGALGLVALSDAGGYRLALVRGSSVEPLPLEPSPNPIEADIGSDADASPAVVLSRCEDSRRRRCDLFLHRIGTTGELPIRAANTSAAETSPTVWRGRIAWARGPDVYTRRLRSGRTVPSRRLAGVPRRRCDLRSEPSQSCVLKNRAVGELELRDDRLALRVSYNAEGAGGHYQEEVRLDDLHGGAQRLASMTAGEGGQTLLGLSFAGGRLGWHRSCYGTPCGGTAYRYGLRTGRYEIASGGRSFAGFALTTAGFRGMSGGFELGADDPDVEECDGGCSIVDVRDVRWRRLAQVPGERA